MLETKLVLLLQDKARSKTSAEETVEEVRNRALKELVQLYPDVDC